MFILTEFAHLEEIWSVDSAGPIFKRVHAIRTCFFSRNWDIEGKNSGCGDT